MPERCLRYLTDKPLVLVCFCDEILKGDKVYLDSQFKVQLIVAGKLRQQAKEAASGITSSQEAETNKQNASFSSVCDLLPIVKMAARS